MHEPLFEKHRMNQIKGDCNNMALYNFIRPSLYIENLFLPPRSNRKYGFLEIYMRIRDCCGVNYIFIRLSTSQVKATFHFTSPNFLLRGCSTTLHKLHRTLSLSSLRLLLSSSGYLSPTLTNPWQSGCASQQLITGRPISLFIRPHTSIDCLFYAP